MATKFTKSDIQAKLDQMFDKNEYILLSDYKKNDLPVKVKHSCGLVYETKIAELTRTGTRKNLPCPCQRRKNTSRTTESHNIEIKEWRGKEFDCLDYQGTRDQLNTYYHSVCGKSFKSSMQNFKLSVHCPICHPTHSSHLKTTKEYQNDLNNKYGKNIYEVVSDYKGNEKSIKVKHKCGQITEFRRAATLLQGIASCRCEHVKNNFRTLKDHNKEVKKWWGKDFICIEYNGSGGKLNKYKHLKCGCTFEKTRPQLQATKNCPGCSINKHHNKFFLTFKEAQKRLNDKYGQNEYKINESSYITSSKHKTEIKHSCGFVYKTKLQQLFLGGSLCPKCFKGKTSLKYEYVNGKVHYYQGYEILSFKHMLNKYNRESILTCHTHEIPRFNYTFEGKECKYNPDFYIPSNNLIVETKGVATFGLIENKDMYYFGKNLLARNQAKAKAVLKKGYDFQLHLWHKDKLVKLPAEWYNMPPVKLKRYLTKKLKLPTPRFRFALNRGINHAQEHA